MNCFRFISVQAALTLWLSALAAPCNIEATPGSLSASLREVPPDATELTISGSIDIRDLIALRDGAESVTSLDLSSLSIAAGSLRNANWYGRTVFPADELPDYIFSQTHYTAITLPASLKVVGEGAFAASALAAIEIPVGVSSIGDYAFHGSAISRVSGGRALASIGKGCFANCASLAEADLSEAPLTAVPEKCFAGCSSLKSLILPPTIATIGSEAFAGTALTQLDVPGASRLDEYSLSGMTSLTEASVSPSAMTDAGTFFGDSSLRSVEGIPDAIPPYSLAECPALDVTAAIANATSIGEGAFAGDTASSLTLGKHLTSISPLALSSLKGLEEVNAVALGPDVPALLPDAFKGIALSGVRLVVKADAQSVWKAHPEWCKFNIVPDTNVGALSGVDAETIRFFPDGYLLIVTAPEDLESVRIYDADGALLFAAAPAAPCCSVDLSACPARIVVATAVTHSFSLTSKLLLK